MIAALVLVGLLALAQLYVGLHLMQAHAAQLAVRDAQIGELLQRIQAPEAAVIQHQLATTAPGPQALPFDDDEAFWQSKEEIAEQLP